MGTVKIRMPLEQVKAHETMNPEMRGAKNWKTFSRNIYRAGLKNNPVFGVAMANMPKKVRNAVIGAQGYFGYKELGKGTVTYQGDVPTQNIVGSKNYQKLKGADVISHIKKRKGMFAKGVARTIGGAALMATPLIVHKLTKEKPIEPVKTASVNKAMLDILGTYKKQLHAMPMEKLLTKHKGTKSEMIEMIKSVAKTGKFPTKKAGKTFGDLREFDLAEREVIRHRTPNYRPKHNS